MTCGRVLTGMLGADELNPIVPDPSWMEQIPVLGTMVGALMASSLILLVGALFVGAATWIIGYLTGATETRGGRTVLAVITGACVLAALPALVSFVDTSSWGNWG